MLVSVQVRTEVVRHWTVGIASKLELTQGDMLVYFLLQIIRLRVVNMGKIRTGIYFL